MVETIIDQVDPVSGRAVESDPRIRSKIEDADQIVRDELGQLGSFIDKVVWQFVNRPQTGIGIDLRVYARVGTSEPYVLPLRPAEFDDPGRLRSKVRRHLWDVSMVLSMNYLKDLKRLRDEVLLTSSEN